MDLVIEPPQILWQVVLRALDVLFRSSYMMVNLENWFTLETTSRVNLWAREVLLAVISLSRRTQAKYMLPKLLIRRTWSSKVAKRSWSRRFKYISS